MAAPLGKEKWDNKPDKLDENGESSMHDGVNRYVCIDCGKEALELYKIYSGGMIKIAHCGYCKGVVDKYVEFDPVIIVLDALLYKPQAYRHILFNTNSNIHWKLSILSLLCDAYTKWALRSDTGSSATHPSNRHFLLFALHWHFYVMFLVAGLELTAFLCGVIIPTLLYTKITKAKYVSHTQLLRALLLCCVGKLFIVPAVIWGQTDIMTCLWMMHLFIFTAAVQAFRVMMKATTVLASSLVLMGFTAQYLSTYLSQYLEWGLTQNLPS
ncbi:protein ARV1-like [Asterias amurensis]|uniref:protein ARV1-like n=1 Tax=Asterias amurensis TaxID=7602 RepID=UPI003AB21854